MRTDHSSAMSTHVMYTGKHAVMHVYSYMCIYMYVKCICVYGCHPVHQKVVGLIPGQGTYLGCVFDPHLGCIQEATY